MATLGTGDYTVSVVFSSDPTQTIAVLPFSKLSWQRVANKPSAASFTIPYADGGIECCGIFGGLRPIDHMLMIERNGYEVWDGPILGWSTNENGDVEIRAVDRSILLSKTLVGRTRHWDAGAALIESILAVILGDGDFTNPPFPLDFDVTLDAYFLLPPAAEVDLHVERLDSLGGAINQIADSVPLYWTCSKGLVQFGEHRLRGALTPTGIIDGYPRGFDNRWLTLSERTVLSRPQVVVDGSNLATQVYLGGSSSGSSGHAVVVTVDLRTAVWYLANGDPPPYILSNIQVGRASLSQFDDASVEAAAELIATEVASPSLTIEQLQLAPSFGGRALLPSLDNLQPGTRFNVAFEDTCAFSVPTSRRVYMWNDYSQVYETVLGWAGDTTHARLDQLDFDVDEGGETVKGSFTATVEIPLRIDGRYSADPTIRANGATAYY